MDQKIFVIASFLAILLPSTIEAVKCYQCNATATCNDPFTAGSTTPTCTGTYCSKTSASVAGYTAVVRECSTGASMSTGCQTANIFGISSSVCICQTDLCNDAPASIIGRSGLLTMGLMVAISLMASVRRF